MEYSRPTSPALFAARDVRSARGPSYLCMLPADLWRALFESRYMLQMCTGCGMGPTTGLSLVLWGTALCEGDALNMRNPVPLFACDGCAHIACRGLACIQCCGMPRMATVGARYLRCCVIVSASGGHHRPPRLFCAACARRSLECGRLRLCN